MDLLKGILSGLYVDYQAKPWHQKKNRETLLDLLNYLQKGFKFKNRETMVLDIANVARKENGNTTSRIILEVGNTLMPQSSKIKSDLICTLWEVICKREENNELFTEIITLIHQIDFSDIKSNSKEVICYYALCALVFLKKMDLIDKHLQQYISPNVEMKELTATINAFLDSPNDFTPEDLRVCMG